MEPPAALDDDVVQGLYEAAAGTMPWRVALAGLDAAIGRVLGSQMVVVEKTTGRLVLSEQPDHTPPDGVLEYIREYHRLDPHVPYLVTRPIAEPVHTEEVFPPARFVDHPFYRDFWRPYSVRSFVGAKIAEDERHVAAIGIMRAVDVEMYSAHEIALAGRYFKHLAAAMRISQFLKKVHMVALAGHDLMERSPRPMVLVNAESRILAANNAARTYVASSGALVARDETLHCVDAENERTLRQAVSSLFAAEVLSAHRRTVVKLLGDAKETVLCSLWLLRPQETMAAFGGETVALVTIARPSGASTVDPLLLASMFDLTPAEARLALSLSAGMTSGEVARELGTAISTVRSQLKAVLAKTGTHRQVELVRLLNELANI